MCSSNAPLHNPSGVMCLSNAFVFFQFRTLWPQRGTRNPFSINHLRTLSHSTEGGGVSPELKCLTINHSSLTIFYCFQQLPTIKFCNSRLLTTIQNARGCTPHTLKKARLPRGGSLSILLFHSSIFRGGPLTLRPWKGLAPGRVLEDGAVR